MTEIWSPKDPAEVDRFAIDWRPALGEGTIATSSWSLVVPAGVSDSDPEFDDHFASVVLSGGIAGQIAVILNTITTADGRTLDSTRRVPIIDSAGDDATGYSVPSPAVMITRMPAFAAVDPMAIEAAIADGAAQVTTDWVQADYARAILLYAAHVLTLDGHGTGTEAQLAKEGISDFQQIRSGNLHLQRFDRGPPSVMSSTSFGRRFAQLQRLNFAGPRLVVGTRHGGRFGAGCDGNF